jgi:hypothetical protein
VNAPAEVIEASERAIARLRADTYRAWACGFITAAAYNDRMDTIEAKYRVRGTR